MKIQNLFFSVGIVFLFATLIYFYNEYLFQLPVLAKSLSLLILTIAAFVLADYMQARDI